MRFAAEFAVALLAVLVAVVGGGVGYYLGINASPAQSPIWTDHEQTLTSASNDGTTYISTLRCTYHLADGTTRHTESAIQVLISVARVPDPRTCPPSP